MWVSLQARTPMAYPPIYYPPIYYPPIYYPPIYYPPIYYPPTQPVSGCARLGIRPSTGGPPDVDP